MQIPDEKNKDPYQRNKEWEDPYKPPPKGNQFRVFLISGISMALSLPLLTIMHLEDFIFADSGPRSWKGWCAAIAWVALLIGTCIIIEKQKPRE